MPAPVVRSFSARSCTRTLQPRCASAQAAVSPANPAPAISAWRCFMQPDVMAFAAAGAMLAEKAYEEEAMARLRHFAVCVKDLEKAAAFYEGVFDLKRAGREDLDIGSAIYLTDGVINLALLNFSRGAGRNASDLADPTSHVGAHH